MPFDYAKQLQEWKDQGGHLKSYEAVGQMQELCRASGADFLVVLLPGLVDSPADLATMDDYPFEVEHERIIAEMERRGIWCADSTKNFFGHDPRTLVVNRTDGHYNDAGNRLVAQFLAEQLRMWTPPGQASVPQ